MSLIGNGNSDVKNHFSKHRRSNLHLVTAANHGDDAGVSQENVEIARANAPDPNLTSDQQTAIGSPAAASPTGVDERSMSETPNS
jgi:hypothetical protein